jgi:hypothetical protein
MFTGLHRVAAHPADRSWTGGPVWPRLPIAARRRGEEERAADWSGWGEQSYFGFVMHGIRHHASSGSVPPLLHNSCNPGVLRNAALRLRGAPQRPPRIAGVMQGDWVCRRQSPSSASTTSRRLRISPHAHHSSTGLHRARATNDRRVVTDPVKTTPLLIDRASAAESGLGIRMPGTQSE